MTESQKIWSEARDRLRAATVHMGYPQEFADMMANELKTPRAMDRMVSYLEGVRPRSLETIVDEMLAICQDTETWREKKISQEAQAANNARLFYRRNSWPEDDDE